MKNVLSLVLAYVFLQTQSWALSGGPVYPGGNVSLIGTYAGVLVPDTVQTGKSLSGAPLPPSITSIGLFSIAVPLTGLGAGATIFFVNGDAYTGTITGVADPGKGTFQGIVQTQSNFILFDPANPTIPFRIFASGNIEATIFSLATPTTGQTPGSTRFEGTAAINVSGGGPGYDGAFTYIVDGFKQSDTANATNTLPGGGTGGGTGGTGG